MPLFRATKCPSVRKSGTSSSDDLQAEIECLFPVFDLTVQRGLNHRLRLVDPFVTQLAELCRTNRTGAKWVIVPSYSLGHTLGERLVLEGTDWANLRFTTPLDLALQMAAPFLVERGVDPSSEGLGPALIMSLLLKLPETRGYFRNLAEQPKMAEALWPGG